MTTLTLDYGNRAIDLDLQEPHGAVYDAGDLGAYRGNIYLHIDGREVGSIFVSHDNGVPTITLGQYLGTDQSGTEAQWVARNPIRLDTTTGEAL